MPRPFRIFPLKSLAAIFVLAFGLAGCSSGQPPAATARSQPLAPGPAVAAPVVLPRVEVHREVMLGIDVLASRDFLPLRGKRIGLLTHPAGVNHAGVSTIDILRRTPGLRLVALFSTEHGIYGTLPASKIYPDQIDPRTGLMVYSLYNGKTHKPTKAQLSGIDVLVIDLQDIGVRSYTFAGAMKEALQGCLENNVAVVVLDRPNPLGGLKVDGPLLDPQWMSAAAPQFSPGALVNEFPVPYVHGLTMGELARLAVGTPGLLPEAVRARAHLLTVIPMENWRRGMRWSDTGLPWIPTSPLIPDFGSVMGYAMTGLGCDLGGFQHGVGNQYPFRGISHKTAKLEVVEQELRALHLPGLQYRRVSVPNAKTGQPGIGLYVEVTDWDDWRPTELSFYLMKLDCRLEPKNPFATATPAMVNGFMKLMGSSAFFQDIAAHGARVDVDAYIRQWELADKAYQEQSRRFWLYE